MLDIKQLATMTDEILADVIANYAPDVNVRTIRYYDGVGLLPRPKRVGRDNMYSAEHLKQLVALKILQHEGLSLAQIKLAIKARGRDEILKACGINPNDLEKTMRLNSIIPDETKPSAREERRGQNEMKTKKNVYAGNSKTITATITGADEYNEFREKLRLGSTFAFITGADGDLAKKLHRLINGQKAGAGSVSSAVIPVDGELALPGCSLKATAPAAGTTASVVVADKDVYKEGDDVARVFIYMPSMPSKKAKVLVHLDGATLDTLEVKLDENGCALTRIATLVSGTYTVTLVDSLASCQFEATRYQLAPLTVTATKITKDKNNINVSLKAETYGASFDGETIIAVTDGNADVHAAEVTFKDGRGELAIPLDVGTGPLSLRVQSADDPKLVAGTPIQGSSKAERDDTIISEMGRVTTVSLMGRSGLFRERGLYVDEGEKSNSPVELVSCVNNKVSLKFHKAAKNVVVVLRDALTGAVQQVSEDDVKAGGLIEKDTGFALTAVNVGAIFDDEPWEGHALVVRPATHQVKITAPEKTEPGKTIRVKIEAPKGSSVLLKIVDKRVRAMYDPMVAIASIVKSWASSYLSDRLTGNKLATPPEYIPIRAQFESFGGGILRSAAFGYGGGARGMGGMTFGSAELYSRGPRSKGLHSGSSELKCSVSKSDEETSLDFNVSSNSFAPPEQTYFMGEGAKGFAPPADLADVDFSAMGLVSQAAIGSSGTAVEKKVKARETEADLIYCDLIRVDGEKILAIKLPESTGLLDVKAFAVNGIEWSETAQNVVIEKDVYLEPLIPHMAHPEDGIKARCVAVRAPEGSMFSVRHDGKRVDFKEVRKGANVHLSWDALPGVHEVTLASKSEFDKIMRVVEAPGEETVLTQEMRILKKGDVFDLVDDGALSVNILPGMESELTVAVQVCTEFGHSCCEQSAAMITAACVAFMTGDDSSRSKAKQTVIKGEARMRSMWKKGEGFKTYPDYDSITPDWSASAARRLASLGMVTDSSDLPQDVREAIDSMVVMGKDVLRTSKARAYAGEMETAYYEGKKVSTPEKRVIAHTEALAKSNGYGSYSIKSEAAFLAACLLRDKDIDNGIEMSNAVAKSMGGTMGGGMHGSYESLAYMHMVDELRKAGVVPGSGKGKVKVNKTVGTVENMLSGPPTEIERIEAIDSAVALRISRIERIRFDEVKSGVSMSVDIKAEDGSRDIKPGKPVTVTVKLREAYKEGDVACLVLPDCLSRVVGGALAKKFQVDFRGKSQVQVKLVAHEPTEKPQRWTAVVRNMYDSARIGSVGLMSTAVTK